MGLILPALEKSKNEKIWFWSIYLKLECIYNDPYFTEYSQNTYPQLSENAKSDHFSTFSNWTPCIYYVHGIYALKKEKKFEEKKCSIFCGSNRIRTHNLHVIGSVGQIATKTTKIFSTVKYAQWLISIRIVKRVPDIQRQAQTEHKFVRTR